MHCKVKGSSLDAMNIGELATRCQVPAQTIRFYEREGLLPEAERRPNGYRVYDEPAERRLDFIRRAQGAGLTLAEIRGILDVRAAGRTPCNHVIELLADKLDDVDERLRELRVLRAELTELAARASELDPADCTDDDICHILGTRAAS